MKINRNLLRVIVEDEYAYETEGKLRFTGQIEAPEDLTITIKLHRCMADPQNPLSCVLANLLTEMKSRLSIPREYGLIMRKGIYVLRGVAYIALWEPSQNTYKIMRFQHDGHWVVRAFDTQNPVHLAQMWQKVDKGAVVTLRRMRKSLTKAERDAKAGLPKPAKVRDVPGRGARSKGMPSARRATASVLADAAIKKAAA